MIRSLSRLGPITLTSVFPTSLSNKDVDKTTHIDVEFKESGLQRVRDLFSLSEFNEVTPEMNFVLQSTFGASLFGTIYGGFVYSRTAYMNFIEKNQATHYNTVFDAKKTLQDKVTLSFAKGAWKWGWRMSLFTATYTLLTTCISVYRGKSSIIEYSTAGIVTGALYKSNLGLRASIVGGTLGLMLGTCLGGVSLLILKLSGTTMDNVYKTQYRFKQRRTDHYFAMLDSSSAESRDEVTDYHDGKILMKQQSEANAASTGRNKFLPATVQMSTIADEAVAESKPVETKKEQ